MARSRCWRACWPATPSTCAPRGCRCSSCSRRSCCCAAWRAGGWRNWGGWLAAGAMAVGCLIPVVAYAAWFHSWTGDYALTRSDGFFLWGRVSSFAECSVIKPPADELKVCPAGSPSSRTPPGDYIWHAPQVHDLAGGPVSAANDRLLRDFAIHAVEAQPLGYLHSVLSGLALSVEWPRRPYPDAGTVYYYYFHLQPQTVPANHSWIPGGTAYSDAVQYGHATPEPRRRTVRQPDRRVRARVLHLRPAVRADHADGTRRRCGAAVPAACPRLRLGSAPGLDPALGGRDRQHAALGHRRRAARVPDRGRRLRLPVPAPRPPVRLPGRWPGLRPGPGGGPQEPDAGLPADELTAQGSGPS